MATHQPRPRRSCTREHKQCTAGGFDSAGEDAEVRKFRHYRVAVVECPLGDVNQTVGCSCAAEHNETVRVTVDQTCLNGAFELGPTDFLTRHTSNEVAAGIDAERLTEEAKTTGSSRQQLHNAGITMRRGAPTHPASTQQIVELRDQGLSWTEVAEQIDMTVSGAWSRYYKAQRPKPPRLGRLQHVPAEALDQSHAIGVRAAVAQFRRRWVLPAYCTCQRGCGSQCR